MAIIAILQQHAQTVVVWLIIISITQSHNTLAVHDTIQELYKEIFHNPLITISIKTTISSYGPDSARAKRYVYLTGAAYCFNLHKWSCPYCLKAKHLGYKFHSVIVNKDANTQGLITVNKAEKEIVIAFRGTFNMQNVIQDAASLLAIANPNGMKSKHARVNVGLLHAAKSLYPQVLRKLGKLLRQYDGYDVVLTGHSSGAAIASVTLYMIHEGMAVPFDFPRAHSYALFEYGGPRVGNRAYTDHMNEKQIHITRVVNKADLVSQIPPTTFGYIHYGNELWITPENEEKACSREVYEDPDCSNSLQATSNLVDHLEYWDVQYLSCAQDNPMDVLKQFFVHMPNKIDPQ